MLPVVRHLCDQSPTPYIHIHTTFSPLILSSLFLFPYYRFCLRIRGLTFWAIFLTPWVARDMARNLSTVTTQAYVPDLVTIWLPHTCTAWRAELHCPSTPIIPSYASISYCIILCYDSQISSCLIVYIVLLCTLRSVLYPVNFISRWYPESPWVEYPALQYEGMKEKKYSTILKQWAVKVLQQRSIVIQNKQKYTMNGRADPDG